MNLNQETKTKNVWYRQGEEPIIEAKRKGESTNFYGALNMKNGKCAAMETNKQNSQTTIEFLKKLLKIYQHRKIFLIWDGAGWHKSKEIRKFLSETNQGKTKLELFNFPPIPLNSIRKNMFGKPCGKILLIIDWKKTFPL